MKSYSQFINKSVDLDESIVGRYFDASRFGPGGNNNTTTGMNANKKPLTATSQRTPQKQPPLKNIYGNSKFGRNLRAAELKTGRKIRDKVSQVKKEVKKEVDNPNRKNLAIRAGQKAINALQSPGARETLSALNQVRKRLPTAKDFTPTSQAGMGFGGMMTGRSFKGFAPGVAARKKFAPNQVITRTGAGGKGQSQVIYRGDELDADGNPIKKPKDTSFRGKLKNVAKRALGIKDTPPSYAKPKPKPEKDDVVTGSADDEDTGSKVTQGKGGGPKTPPQDAAAEAPKAKRTVNKKASSTSVNVSRKQPQRSFRPEPEKPDDKIRVTTPKTDPSKLNPVKGYKQEDLPGIKSDDSSKSKTEKTPKKPRKQRTPEEQAEINKKRAATRAANQKKKDDAIGQQSFDFDNLEQTKKNAAEKSGVKITGDTQPKITGTKKDKVTSSDNVDKTSKPVEKPVEKPKSNEVAITDAREKKTPGKKRGPKKGSTNVRTLARQNREKKQQETQAKERLASAVKKQEEQDKKNPIEQAKQDSKTSTALKGSNLDRNRKELAKMLKLTPSSKQKKSTQIQGISDEELARSGGSKKNIDDLIIKAKKGEAEEQEKLVKNEIKMQKRFGKPGPQSAARKEIDRLRKKDLVNKMKEKDKKKREKKKEKEEKTKTESFSWREEFIWETDKKYPEKVKEIKPMTGKNTITINPEDETSKYKRGY